VTSQKLRVLLVDSREERSAELARGLEEAGCLVVAHTTPSHDLGSVVAACRPDVVIIDVDSPGRDTLEGMRRLDESLARPIVLFTEEGDRAAIRKAIEAGVAAYVVKGARAERVRPVIDVAIARFEAHRALVDELSRVKSTLEERKVVERAKGLLMEKRGLSEADAFATLRRMAMTRGLRLGEVAQRLIEMAEVL